MRVLEREFTQFFTNMLKPEEGWSGVTDQQFVDALAASIMNTGAKTGRGVAMLQTLVYELQEKINQQTKA